MARLQKLFVCIGAQKAGTTWLFENLQRDTRFSRCPFVKEMHYFDMLYNDSPFLNSWRANFTLELFKENPVGLKPALEDWLSNKKPLENPTDEYASLTKTLNTLLGPVNNDWYSDVLSIENDQCCALDITPDYAVIGKKGFEHMKTIAEELKIIYILRNPVDRAWSGLLQSQKRKPGGIREFLKANRDKNDKLFRMCSSGLNIGARNNYLNTLNTLEKLGLANKKHLLIKIFDDIASQPEQFMADIYEFLDIPCPPMTLFSDTLKTRVYSSPDTVMPAILKSQLKAHYKEMIEEINNKFIPLPQSWID